jgi:hypothetical protein
VKNGASPLFLLRGCEHDTKRRRAFSGAERDSTMTSADRAKGFAVLFFSCVTGDLDAERKGVVCAPGRYTQEPCSRIS